MLHGIIFNLGTYASTARTVGPYLISKHLRDNGWDIEIIDFARDWQLDQLKELASIRINKDTKFLGFSFQFAIPSIVIEQYLTWIKFNYPQIIIISGGPIILMSNSLTIDYHIAGYGEYAIEALLKYLFSNGPPIKYSLNHIGAKKVILANDMYPAFPKSSLKPDYQARDFINENEWLTIEFSRGCIFKCAFCNHPIIGIREDYTRAAEDFQEEIINNYNNFGIKNYLVSDETFNDRTEKITKYANIVEKLEFTPFFSGFVRADLLVSRPQDKEELLRMNFLGHYYGIESFNKETGKIIGKGMDPDRLKHGLIDIKKYFKNNGRKLYRGTIGLIIGLPYDTFNNLDETKQWLFNNWRDQNFVTIALQLQNSNLDNLSKMSINYKKYGYEKMSLEESNIIKEKYKSYHFNFASSRDEIYWKNKDMNIGEAKEYSSNLEKYMNANFNVVNNWDLGKNTSVATVEERLAPNANTFKIDNYNKLVNDYVLKKLSI